MKTDFVVVGTGLGGAYHGRANCFAAKEAGSHD